MFFTLLGITISFKEVQFAKTDSSNSVRFSDNLTLVKFTHLSNVPKSFPAFVVT